ncbi:hypothetical protein [Jatrophihabitans sp.]|uniref:hypothetical protein n=1 Tax=Jatrophihabitans sp. TaxID=1932789 RepID=UPI0030C7091A|nr:hypothetical protein [Jatrophihabitans sp.]
MTNTAWTRRATTLAKITAVVGGSALLFSSPASAATISQSTASALNVSVLSTPLIPVSSAADDGSTPTDVATVDGAIPLLPGETLANTGIYAQTARATDSGTSSACAGVVGAGSALSLGQDGSCDASATTGPSIINLPGFTVAGTGFSFKLKVSALYSVCTAGPSDSSTGFSADSTLANVDLIATTSILGINGPDVDIPINLTAPISIPAPFNNLVSLDVNQVDTTGPTTSATALHIGLGPNSSLFSLDIGKVTCGANAITADTPMLPAKGLWVAGGTAVLIGGGYAASRRRRQAPVASTTV